MSDELDPRLSRSLQGLRQDAATSPGLEGQVLEELNREGLLRRPVGRIGPALGWAALLAGVFAAGILVGDRRYGPAETIGGDRYVLLLLEGPRYRAAGTPDAERARVAKYAAWARDLAEAGRFVEGEKLDMTTERLGEPAVGRQDGEVVAGFFVIEAASLQEALQVARTIPHLRYGGAVEVRRIEPTGS